MISYNKFWSLKTKDFDLTVEPHHPSYHLDTNKTQCQICDLSFESVRSEYNRVHPNAQSDGNYIVMEIMDQESNLPAVPRTSFVEKFKEKALTTSEMFGLAISKREKQLATIKKDVEESLAMSPKGFNGKQVLYMPDVGYTRSFSIIESLKMLEDEFGERISKRYDIISGSGGSSIIAICLSIGMSVSEIKTFWIEKWINAYKVGAKDRLFRSLTIKKVYGFRVKKAKSILESFFGENMTMSDLESEVHLLAMFGRYKETQIYSKLETPNVNIIDVLMDTAIDPTHFDAKETVEGKGTPLTVNDLELNILLNNKSVLLTKMEVPFLHSDYGNLNNATAAELSNPNKDATNFMNKVNTESFSKNFSPKRVKILTKEIPSVIPRNSTDKKLIELAIEAGKNPTISRN